MATPHLLRSINETRVLQLLLERGPRSRADIARDLQVTRSTASALVAGLVERGLLLETEETGDAERIGRPGFVLKLNGLSRIFIGVDIAVSELRLIALDLGANLIASLTIPYVEPTTPDYVVGLVREGFDRLMDDNQLDRGAIEGIGVAIPGLVENDGLIVFAPILNWRNIDIKSMLVGVFDHSIPLHFDNDANACAVSEGYRKSGKRDGTLAFLLMDSGVGLGILHQGQVFRGQEGLAGEFGHNRFHATLGDEGEMPHSPTFEETVGREAVLRLCSKHKVRVKSLRDFVELAKSGDDAALEVFDIWAQRLALGMANLCMILNPEEIVVGGKTAALFSINPKRVYDHANRHFRFMFKTPVLRASDLGVLAASVGVASTIHRQSFTLPSNTDQILSA
ncbi:MAG: ROK family transcriptional regulator [Hyphomicrobiales bacterium]